jgi:long-chain acyl-CoA synthetase
VNRFWLQQYPDGVPADVDVHQYSSLIELFEESFTTFADRKAAICMDKAITYGEFDEISAAIGAYLQSRGLARGARVAVMMPNVLQNPVALTAGLRAGYTIVNVNPLYTPRELEHQLTDSGAEAIVILENFATTLEKVLPRTSIKHIIVGAIGDLLGLKGVGINFIVRKIRKMVPAYSLPGAISFKDALSAGRKLKLNKPNIGPNDVAFLQYTGGTTGVSKGATLLHRNMVANVLQIEAWSNPALRKPPLVEPFLTVCALPLYHIFALTACFLFSVRVGGTNLLMINPRDIPGFIKELRKHKVHSFPAVNHVVQWSAAPFRLQ